MTMAAFQSTLPTRGSDSCRAGLGSKSMGISIHAPHEGERPCFIVSLLYTIPISIHAPHEGERRTARLLQGSGRRYFNPRSPRGGATPSISPLMSRSQYFNPRSPQGGATQHFIIFWMLLKNFNPRSPQGGATNVGWICSNR